MRFKYLLVREGKVVYYHHPPSLSVSARRSVSIHAHTHTHTQHCRYLNSLQTRGSGGTRVLGAEEGVGEAGQVERGRGHLGNRKLWLCLETSVTAGTIGRPVCGWVNGGGGHALSTYPTTRRKPVGVHSKMSSALLRNTHPVQFLEKKKNPTGVTCLTLVVKQDSIHSPLDDDEKPIMLNLCAVWLCWWKTPRQVESEEEWGQFSRPPWEKIINNPHGVTTGKL